MMAIEAMVRPSIQPLALTSCEFGSNSVRMPYFAGEYAAAPRPTMPYESSGSAPNRMNRQPMILIAFETNITVPLGTASAKAPTRGARST